jgi:hypothetical protein
VELADTTLYERARAARELVRFGRLDGDLALSYVIWPEISPIDVGKPFRLIAKTFEPYRCQALTRSAAFPSRCSHRVVQDGLCGRHLRCLREGKPIIYFWEEEK